MPKVIKGLREKILEEARDIIMTTGYDSFSIRQLAENCGIATGTLYNYFDTKDTILAYVMMDDWKKILDALDRELPNVKSVPEGAIRIFHAIRDFFNLYVDVFRNYSGSEAELHLHTDRHLMLREQIAQRCNVVFEAVNFEEKRFAAMTAEAILAFAIRPEFPDEDVETVLGKLFN